jgi:RNA polymerase sigma factor (sigma-70 family)
MAAVVLGTALSTMGPALQAREARVSPSAVEDLSRYCTTCWRNARLPADAWGDCTQEVLCRLLRTVPMESWDRVLKEEGTERREFVRAIDAVKKRTQRRKKWTDAGLESADDGRDVQRRRIADERALVRQVSGEVLTARQRQIMQLAFDGWSVNDISSRLDLPAERVSDEKYKAIRKLRSRLADS